MVDTFYSILHEEERALEHLSNGKLTLKEIHLIEAVYKEEQKSNNTFSGVANNLRISLGTLTEAYKKLEKKGYLTKKQDKYDKRVYYIMPTPIALLINDEHTKWHKSLIDAMIKTIPENDLPNFILAIKNLRDFFRQ
ncbi:MAG: MarR family transcriptional regulator [Firmicutes bacterium]|nr:MarR family transcriptional regulator [Bacillota bacterium]